MSIFGNLKTEGLEESQDRLGGYRPLESDIYTGTIKAFYMGQSTGGSTSISLIADFNGQEYRETFYVTNKKGENFFYNKDDKTKKVPLPGFTYVNDICLITTGEPLADQEKHVEEKTIKLYDSEAKKELPKAVNMIMSVVGQKISLGVLKNLENKSEKVGEEYVDTAETRDTNSTDKVFHPVEKLTVVEALAGATEAKFWDGWLERNKGNTRDKRTIKDDAAGATRGAPKGSAPAAGASTGEVRKSLFGAKK